MGSVIVLRPKLRVDNIKKRESNKDDVELGIRCVPLFKNQRGMKIMILSKRGEMIFGFERLGHVLEFYRNQEEIQAVALVPSSLVDDLKRNY
jgi:hypothetical protein